MLKCKSKGKCDRWGHIYCSLKNFRAEEGKGWRMLDQPLPSGYDNMETIENLLYRAVKGKNTLLASQLGVKKGFKVRSQEILFFCPEHSTTIVDCKCEVYDDNKTEWLFCDTCLKW